MSDDLAALDVVPDETEAGLICSLLHDAGIPAMHRLTAMGSGAAGGLPIGGGPREILVRAEQLERARTTLEEAERRSR
jgi:hypothetical protein